MTMSLLYHSLILFLAVTLPLLDLVDAAVYIDNETFPSLPALFGKPMMEGLIYEARLQFLRENPYLCEDYNNETSTYIEPPHLTLPMGGSGNGDDDAEGNGDIELDPEYPVILLAARGQCPFAQKAKIAESISKTVQYLMIYNYNVEGEDTLVPMYSELGDTRLVLLSVTHRAGLALKRFIVQQPASITLEQGGPVILFDGLPPEGLLTFEDLRDMLLSALGLFFLLISLSGCIMIVAATSGMNGPNGGGPLGMGNTRIIISSNGTPLVVRTTGGRRGGNALVNLAHSMSGRNFLLTEEQVRHLTTISSNNNQDNQSTAAGAAAPADDASCAICFDDFYTNDNNNNESNNDGSNTNHNCNNDNHDHDQHPTNNITVLPCQHKFHTDCIVPWLTERQSKCPLCKFDLVEYVREKEEQALELELSSSSAATAAEGGTEPNDTTGGHPTNTRRRAFSVWDRVVRYRNWTSVLGYDDDDDDDDDEDSDDSGIVNRRRRQRRLNGRRRSNFVIIRPEEMDVSSSSVELELTTTTSSTTASTSPTTTTTTTTAASTAPSASTPVPGMLT